MLYVSNLSSCQNRIIFYFWLRKRSSRVKLMDTCLISSAIPFLLSARFLRRPFHIENTEYTILWMVSRLRAALVDLRLILSCRRLTSIPQCMLSIDQWPRTYAPRAGVSVGRLLTYNRFSAVRTPVDFFTVLDSYSIIVMLPPHFPLSAIASSPS